MDSQPAKNANHASGIDPSRIFLAQIHALRSQRVDRSLNHHVKLHFTASSIWLSMRGEVHIHAFELGRCLTNAYVLEVAANPGRSNGSSCWVVDPGEDPETLLSFLASKGLTPEAIVLTHAHADHIAGVDQVRAMFPRVPIMAHAKERDWFQDPKLNLSLFIGEPVCVSPPTASLEHDQTLSLGGVPIRVLETPGHSPGSVTLYCPSGKFAIVGDTLFQQSIGRSDFPGSDPETLLRSIHEVLMPLPPDTAVYPGHGPSTTIGAERAGNPFLQ